MVIPQLKAKAIPIKCFISYRPPSRKGRSVGREKKRNEHMKGSASEGRATKYENLVTWSFRSQPDGIT